MVKPSKSMQPEAVDLDEINKKGTRGMGDDDFRNYMARKIDLQRRQFGVVLPPPPPPPDPHDDDDSDDERQGRRRRKVKFANNDYVVPTKKQKVNDMSRLIKTLKKRHGSTKRRRNNKKKSGKAVDNDEFEFQCNTDCVAQVPQDSDSLLRFPDHDGTQGSLAPLIIDDSPGRLKSSSPPPRQRRRQNEDDGRRSDLFFRGIVVLVNGYTVPDTDTLMRLLHKRGGDLEKYETTRVTHIVAHNLSTAKANMYKKQRQPTPVVRPEWIVDSDRAGKLLPFGDYLIKEVQPEATSSVKNFLVPPAQQQERNAQEGILKKDSGIVNLNSQRTQSPSLQRENDTRMQEDKDVRNIQNSLDTDDNIQSRSVPSKVNGEEPSNNGKASAHRDVVKGSRIDTTIAAVTNESTSIPDQDPTNDASTDNTPAVLEKANPSDVKKVVSPKGTASARAQPNGTSFPDGRTRTVGTDPNFLDNYFHSSRLSFIGSFKQRARQSPTKKRRATQMSRAASTRRFVFLVDMDCFFASVVLRNYPECRDKPVAISHLGKQQSRQKGSVVDPTHLGGKDSTSECATCNYQARKYGIQKGMFLGRARELCPTLVVLPYDFEGYEEVSEQVADILYRVADIHGGTVEQVSCDESYLELFLSTEDETKSADEVALTIADGIREDIYEATQCTATVGVASNKLLAKLAADKVKPNKSMVVKDHRALLEPLKLRDLHGIGYQMDKKLMEENLVSVPDVWDLGDHAESELSRILGPGLGKKIASFCKGEDERPVQPAERKTIGAECNYGVRFDGPFGVDYMVEGLAKEVHKRMKGVGVKGSRVTLKVKQRKQGAKPPPKFLGHGSCHNLSKSTETVGSLPTNESQEISRISMQLLRQMEVPTDDIRGMGIVVSKLNIEHTTKELASDPSGRITSWFGQPTTKSDSSGSSLLRSFDNTDNADRGVQPTDVSMEFTVERPCAEFENASETTAFPEAATIETGAQAVQTDESSDVELEETTDGKDMQQSSIILSQQENEMSPSNDSVEWRADDIDLPPVSQIHLSQVAELPTPIRKSIMTRMAVGQEDQRNVVRTGDYETESARIDGLNAVSREAQQASADVQGTSMRQMNLKRMMKLAAVKSGEDTSLSESIGGSISLTQLECLPLEMQLQIANNEDVGSSHRLSSCATRNKPRPSKPRQSISPVHKKVSSKDRLQVGSGDEVNGQQERAEQMPAAETRIPFISKQPSFYHENIAPLMAFMDINPDAEDAASQTVQEFLLICIAERRFTDAVTMLRSIKNRGDAWSLTGYRELVSVVNEQVRLELGKSLDLCALGL